MREGREGGREGGRGRERGRERKRERQRERERQGESAGETREEELGMMAAVLPMSNPLTHCLKVSLLLSSECSDDQTLKITCESFI